MSAGRSHSESAAFLESGRDVELVFETEAMICRLRVPPSKIEETKATWNGEWFQYVLGKGDAVWQGF